MKLYFDNCCYGRPYDDQSQDEIRAETDAVQNVIKLAQWYGYTIFGSVVLDIEIGKIKNKDAEKYEDVWGFYQRTITSRAGAEKHVVEHYTPLALQAGVRGLDVFHLCVAISAGVDYLVTTDKKFIKAAAGLRLSLTVINPLNFPLGGII
jgi:predicted nucleic acid-binding protein